MKLVANGEVDPTSKRIVIVLTGHGLKDPGIAVSEAAEPLKLPADVDALDDYLE
jgi:threonine synthase